MAGRIKQLIDKYGWVALAVHLSVSAASYTSCYIAVKSNVDVTDLLQRVGLLPKANQASAERSAETVVGKVTEQAAEQLDHAASKVLNEGGAFALAFVCNKALLPVRIPLTVLLTPPIARVWARTRFLRRT